MAKEFFYRGKNVTDIKKMSLEDFAKLVPSRERRKIKRGFRESEKILLEDLKKKDFRLLTENITRAGFIRGFLG